MSQATLFPTGMAKDAVLSPCGLYRYRLSRRWGEGKAVHFIMLNPSTADASQDDATIRRCLGFAESWGYVGLVVTNLFAYRSRDPEDLKRAADPVGQDNGCWILDEAIEAALTVCAWGIHGKLLGRDRAVLELLRAAGIPLYCLSQTATGMPAHPLFLPARLTPQPLDPETILR